MIFAEKAKANIVRAEKLLKDGASLKVDRETGFVVNEDSMHPIFAMTDFRWLEKRPDDVFDISGLDWQDYTQPLVEEFPGDCVLMTNFDTLSDAEHHSLFGTVCYVDRRSGATRRVPCRLGPTSMSCFSASLCCVHKF
jgi:hypothetical protein